MWETEAWNRGENTDSGGREAALSDDRIQYESKHASQPQISSF